MGAFRLLRVRSMVESDLIQPQLLVEIKTYFRSNLDQESCGVILKSGEFLPLKNFNPSLSSFQLHPKLYFLMKHITCVAHSHVLGDAYPSPQDMVESSSSSLPYLVYSCVYDNFVYFDLGKCIPMKV